MSWVPRDLTSVCREYQNVTTCAPTYIMFLTMISRLFGLSRDDKKTKVYYNQYLNPNYFHQSAEPSDLEYTFFQNSLISSFNSDLFKTHWGSSKTSDESIEEYDFIIVGAGSAGCVLANRLSEIHRWNILLLEAGIEEPKVAEVPAFAPMLQRSNIDWNYMTQPETRACLARPNKQCYWGRGKVMGGSSTINYMMYVRGNPQDYDFWATMGNYGWSYDDVLPYFKKSEKNTDSDIVHINSQYHGEKGYQFVGRFPYLDTNALSLVQAWNELGFPTTDVNSDAQIGVMKLQMTQHNGMRVSTNAAYIRPIRKKRKNLVIKTKAHVLRVLINPNKEAYGVEYSENGVVKIATARKEVILSAGSINSPKILMLSGVGPRHYLTELGIKTEANLMVGQNLEDHVTFDGLIFRLHPNISVTNKEVKEQENDVNKYLHKKKNPLVSTGPLSCGVFVQSKYEYQPEYPDIQYAFEGVNIEDFMTDPGRASEYNVAPLSYYNGIHVRPILLAPKSKGFLLLNSSDPLMGAPEIYPNYFTHYKDVEILLQAIEIAIELLQTESMRSINAQLLDQPLPGCRSYLFGSRAYWICVITHYTSTIFHPVGTCKMGGECDSEAVVDNELRVHGIRNLRVIDASIMPRIVRGNTNAPTIMIAEKGADLIKEYWTSYDSYSYVNKR